MEKKDIVNLFGLEISKPLKSDAVKRVLDILSKLAIDNFANEDTTIEQMLEKA